MIDIQTVSIMIASAGVFVAAIYYIFQIRHQTRVRQTDVIMRMYSTFNSKEFQEAFTKIVSLEFKDYNDFVKKYGLPPSESPVHVAIMMVCTFFNGVGILLYRRLVDISLVDDLFRDPITMTWEKTKPIMIGAGKQLNVKGFVYFNTFINH